MVEDSIGTVSYTHLFENIYENCPITVVKLVEISYNDIYIG